MKFKRSLFIMFLAALLFALAACSSDEPSSSNDAQDNTANDDAKTEEKSDAVLNIAIDGPPPTLDHPTSTATAVRDTARLIYESLVATDADFNPVPVLAESIETEDNQTYVFHLRQGVKFHNGEEMTAEDVVASMYRWMEKSGLTGNIFNDATWTAQDDYTVVLELTRPSALTLDTLASAKQAAVIMPKEIVENAPPEGVSEYIGTGPYKFVEWKQDQYIHFTRFDDYQSPPGEANGLVGKKEAIIKDIYFHIVTDSSTRLSGLQTGQYDFIYGVPYDYYDQIQNDPNLDSLLTPAANPLMAFNNVEGISTNAKIRQAINAALNVEEILMGAFPNPDFFWVDSGYMDVNIKPWASKAGSEYYNQNDLEKAKQLLEEAGYNGEEFRLMATRDYDHHYNMAVVIHDQLKKMGINAKLDIYDWPTVLEKSESKFGDWDAYITTASTVSTPTQLIALGAGWSGDYPEVDQKLLEIETASTLEEAQALWDDLQLLLWEEIQPIAHIGGYSSLYGFSKKLEGITATTGPIFWNVTKSE